MYKLNKLTKPIYYQTYGARVGVSVKKERKKPRTKFQRGMMSDTLIEVTTSTIPQSQELSRRIVERATKQGDIDFLGPAIYNQGEDETDQIKQEAQKEMKAARGVFNEPVEDYLEKRKGNFERFKEQLNMDGDFEAKLQEMLKPKGIQYLPTTKIKISKKPLPEYYTQEDHEFNLYTKQAGANFLKFPDYSNMSIEEIKNSDPSFVPEGFTGEKVEEQSLSAREFFRRSNKLTPGTIIDEPNPLYSHLFTSSLPPNISKNDLYKIYIVNDQEYKKFFPYGAGALEEVWKKLCQRGVMVRPYVLPVFEFIDDFVKGVNKKMGYLFSGVQGGGKSFLLFQALHYSLYKEIIIFSIPSLYDWLYGIHYIIPNPLLKGYYDPPSRVVTWMRQFRHQNSGILRGIFISTNYNFPLKTNSDFETRGIRNLDDLCSYGSSNEYLAVIAFKLLMDELFYLKDVKVLFVIDDYNYSHEYSGFHFGDLMEMSKKDPERIHARQFVLIRAIERFMGSQKPNYAFICADSHKHKTETKWTLMHRNALCAINVPRYSYPEMNTITSYYTSSFFVYGTPRQFMEDFVFITGGNPGKIWKQVQYY